MEESKVIIVDESDKLISHKKRAEITQLDIYRVSALWITNSKGDILLAQRKFTKKNDPGKWGTAVAGTIEEGETYDTNILKEAQEEIGLTNYSFQKSKKVRISGEYNFFCQWYRLNMDKEINYFKIQEDEVECVKWFTRNELLDEVTKFPAKFLGSMKDTIKLFD